MSVPPRRRLPERPSLEQLRKQAKEHLDTLRAGDPSVNLAAAQHALAREYGFDSWPKLVHHVETVHPANRMLQPAELKSDQKLVWSPGRGTDVWALMQACTSGDLERVRALIAEDPSLARSHYDYRKPLYFAVRENRIDIVQFLLEHDRNPIDLWVDDDPIEIARDRGYTEMEQLLAHTLETTFNASAKGEPVALSLRNHDLQQMNELLDAQPELVGKGDRRSNQPIHWATMTRQLDAIDELLRRGADINARRMDGGRPIHLTNGDYFYRGWRDVPRHWPVTAAQVMAYLKARGAFIDQLLLERGAFPNPPVESSGDALWWSRERRPDKRMEQLLLSYGAKPTKGHTGEDWPQEAYNWLRISPLHQAAQGRCAGGEETARSWRRSDRAR